MKCFYHRADLDGKCSGAIVKDFISDVELIGINYGDPFPWDSIKLGEGVILVDFCLQPFKDMVKLNNMAKLFWIDHHQSSLDAIREYETMHPLYKFEAHGCQIIDTSKAACQLVWEYCYPAAQGYKVPRAVDLIGWYDTWQWQKHRGSLEFQYGIQAMGDSMKPDNGIWKVLLNDNEGQYTSLDMVSTAIQKGRDIVYFKEMEDAAYAKECAFQTTIEVWDERINKMLFHPAIAVNRGLTGSRLFKSVYDPAKHDLMVAFVWKGGQWTVSLYSEKLSVNASKIARYYKGGGHPGAAGFQCKDLPFLLR